MEGQRIIECYEDALQSWEVGPHLDQIDTNLIYMTADGQEANMEDLIEEEVEAAATTTTTHGGGDEVTIHFQECEVTEEVITDDWVQMEGSGNVIQVTVDQLKGGVKVEEDVVPLPEEQDEYTTSRPYPCDFCSRRFRKKANLMNHMIAHQNDRPHVCNLCGARYIRKSDLLNHLKTHAYNEDGYVEEEQDLVDFVTREIPYAKPDIDLSDLLASPSTSRKYKYRKFPPPPLPPPPTKKKKPQKLAPVQMKYTSDDPRKPFVCQVCGVLFARSKALAAHVRLHGGTKLFECDVCGDMLWDAVTFRKHKQKHFLDEQAVLDAEFDDEATESDIEARGMEDPIYGCSDCAMCFQTTAELDSHILLAHMDENLHCCNVCGETFEEALDLLAHAEVHARTQHHQCLLCGERFGEELGIKLHINEMHRHELTDTTCRICGKICKDGRSLMRHSWDHSKERSHSCSRCAKTFQNKARLKRHMLSHKNKNVMCDTCGEDFPDGRSLMNHRHSHTKSMQFRCTECGKSFGSRSSQQIHLRIHTGEKPYGCRFCWKAFADGGTLRKHERIHTGEKPYGCAVCPRAFNQRVVLREHIRSHHSAPDLKNGRPYSPYFCVVCTETYCTPTELINHLVEHSDHNTQARRQPIIGPRKYKRRRSRPESTGSTKHISRKDVEEEIVTFAFRKSVPAKVSREDFELPSELLRPLCEETVRKKKPIMRFKQEPNLDEIAIKSESFPLLDDGKPLEAKITDVDFFSDGILVEKFDPDLVNDLKEILQSPVKERNDGRPRRSARPTKKSLESQKQEKEFRKSSKNVENRCQICGLAFSTRTNLISHVQVHI